MKTKPYLKIWFVAIFMFFSVVGSAQSAYECTEDVSHLQKSGSIYRICMPTDVEYNGKLVIWAHGFQDATDEVSIPEDQLSFGDFSIPAVITSLAYG